MTSKIQFIEPKLLGFAKCEKNVAISLGFIEPLGNTRLTSWMDQLQFCPDVGSRDFKCHGLSYLESPSNTTRRQFIQQEVEQNWAGRIERQCTPFAAWASSKDGNVPFANGLRKEQWFTI